MGVTGAAVATVISQAVSSLLLLFGTTRGENLRIDLRLFRPHWADVAELFRGGFPSLCRQSLSSCATIALNFMAGAFGEDAAIAAMGIAARVMHMAFAAILGFGQGFQPFCGFNYGAGLYSRVKKGFWFCVKGSFGFLLVIAALVFGFAPKIVSLFRDDPDVIRCGAAALRFQCMTFPLQSWIVMSNMMEQVMGKTVPATFLAVARQGLFFIPSVLILSVIFGETGIQMSQMVADLLTALCAIPIQLFILRHMPKEDRLQA